MPCSESENVSYYIVRDQPLSRLSYQCSWLSNMAVIKETVPFGVDHVAVTVAISEANINITQGVVVIVRNNIGCAVSEATYAGKALLCIVT